MSAGKDGPHDVPLRGVGKETKTNKLSSQVFPLYRDHTVFPARDQCMPHDTNATLVVSCWSRNWISSRRGFHEMGEADDFFTALCTRNSVALFFFVSICQAFFWGTVQRWYDRKP